MEKEMMFRAKEYLSDQCYGNVYVKYFPETDDLFVKFNFDGIEVKITADNFLSNVQQSGSISDLMDDVLKRARFTLCNIISNRYFR